VNARRHSHWQTALGAVWIIALVSWFVLGILETSHYRKFIPGELQVLGPVFIDSNENLGTLIGAMLIRPEFCGAAIYQLAPATLRQIERDGLEFFKEVTESRGRFDMNGTGPDGATKVYVDWQPGPLPHNWTRNVTWSGLLCTDISPEMARQLNAAAAEPQTFYTRSRDGNALVVLPNLGWVVFTYWD
jgi:hypothetical protein